VFWVISVYFNIRNTLPKSGTFLLGHPVYFGSVSPSDTNVTLPHWNSTDCHQMVGYVTRLNVRVPRTLPDGRRRQYALSRFTQKLGHHYKSITHTHTLTHTHTHIFFRFPCYLC